MTMNEKRSSSYPQLSYGASLVNLFYDLKNDAQLLLMAPSSSILSQRAAETLDQSSIGPAQSQKSFASTPSSSDNGEKGSPHLHQPVWRNHREDAQTHAQGQERRRRRCGAPRQFFIDCRCCQDLKREGFAGHRLLQVNVHFDKIMHSDIYLSMTSSQVIHLLISDVFSDFFFAYSRG